MLARVQRRQTPVSFLLGVAEHSGAETQSIGAINTGSSAAKRINTTRICKGERVRRREKALCPQHNYSHLEIPRKNVENKLDFNVLQDKMVLVRKLGV